MVVSSIAILNGMCYNIVTVKGTKQTIRKGINTMKIKKFRVHINGHYVTSFRSLSEAKAYVRINERQDRYERDVCGYTNPLPTYEIKTA